MTLRPSALVAYVFHAKSSHGLLHFTWVLVWFGDFGFFAVAFFVLFLGQGLSRAPYGNQAILKPPKCWDDKSIGHSGFTHPKETPSQGASDKRRNGATVSLFAESSSLCY